MKGFTLVELLTVIIVLGIISMITIPIIIGNLSDAEDTLKKDQIKLLESSAEKWSINNAGLLSKTSEFSYCVTIEAMKKEGLLTSNEILDPKTKNEMTGCVNITYDADKNQFKYNYTE